MRTAIELMTYQTRARTVCTLYAEGLGIPLVTISSGDLTGFSSSILSLAESPRERQE